MLSNRYIARFLNTCIDTKIPGLIMSVPGVGKTTTIELYAKYKDYNLTTVIASQYSSDDLLGIQSVVDGKLDRLAPYWYTEMIEQSANGKFNILFIDELTTCDEFVQAPLLNLIFNKSLGKHKLPENTAIISAGNYSENLNNAFCLSAPLVNRFLILNLSYDTIDYNEVVGDNLEKAVSSNNLDNYLGLNSIADYMYDLSKIKNDVMMNIKRSSAIENNEETGLLGFTSPRSLSYAFKFLESYARCYQIDAMAFKVVGDTLGRTSSDKLFRVHLSERSDRYVREASNSLIRDCIAGLKNSSTYKDNMDKLLKNVGFITEDNYRELNALQKGGAIPINDFMKLSEEILKITES